MCVYVEYMHMSIVSHCDQDSVLDHVTQELQSFFSCLTQVLCQNSVHS